MVSVVPSAQDEEALGGLPQEVAGEESTFERHADELAGDDIQEAPPPCRLVFVVGPQQDPPPGVEPAVQDAVGAQVGGGRAPRPAHRVETEEVDVVVGEDTLGDMSRRPGREVRPIFPAGRRHVKSLGKSLALDTLRRRREPSDDGHESFGHIIATGQ